MLDGLEIEDERSKYTKDKIEDSSNELAFCLERCGFYIGIMIRGKMAGASEKQLRELGARVARAIAETTLQVRL